MRKLNNTEIWFLIILGIGMAFALGGGIGAYYERSSMEETIIDMEIESEINRLEVVRLRTENFDMENKLRWNKALDEMFPDICKEELDVVEERLKQLNRKG